MQDLIENLDDPTAIRVLQAFASARSRDGGYETDWSPALQQGIVEGLELSDVPSDRVSEGDLARQALLLLAESPDEREALEAMIKNPPAEQYGVLGMLTFTAAFIALQMYGKLEIKGDKFHFKLEKKPPKSELLQQLAQKLLSFFSSNPPGST